jgi:glycine C-acetyltransferase
MYSKTKQQLKAELTEIRNAGLYKEEWAISSPQGAEIRVADGREVLNFCANNYLGLSNHPSLLAAAKQGLDKFGYGMSSVRFICGTQDLHKQLEKQISAFFDTEDTILYSSCFDANGGLFETLLNEQDTIISDQLNHASIIDGIRLCKAERRRYQNADMGELEQHLKETQDKRRRLIATDGVFSMDGIIAPLDKICDLADKYDALVMVDDSHATGFIGKHGRGTPEHCKVEGRLDVMTSTLGKALGGASGGFTTGRKEIIEYLRQRSRPYLFSNTLAPVIAATSIKAFELLTQSTALRDKLEENTRYFRKKITEAGFEIRPPSWPAPWPKTCCKKASM